MEKPKQPDDSTPEAKPSKPRRLNEFLQRWLERRREPLTLDADNPETGTKPEKKSRWQGVLGGLSAIFRGTVDKPEYVPPVPSEPAGETVGGDLRPGTPETPPTLPVIEDRADTSEKPPETPPAGRPGTEAESSPAEPVVAAETADALRIESETSGPSPADMIAAEHMIAPFRRAEAATPPTPTVERVVEANRGAAAVGVLLGMEYVGRKRADRKLRKEFDKKLAKQTKQAAGEVKKVEANTQTTKQEVKTVQQQARAFEAKLSRPNSQKVVPRPEKSPVQAERQTVIFERARPQPDAPETKPEKLPAAEQVAEKTEQLKRPEAVLEQVEAAAEKDIPLEAAYERRHEVKDQQPDGAAIGGAGGPGASREPILLAQALKERIAKTEAAAVAAERQNLQPPVSQDLYKQAVKNGVWGAVVLLIFMAILFVISH